VSAPGRKAGAGISIWISAVALVTTAVTAGLVVVAAGAAPAAADPIGDCSTTTGVIVVVDFSSWGGAVERGCDATLTTGYNALHAAGFTTAGDEQDGPAFICRIDDEPPPSQDPCVVTPPVNASWSYWHADVGQNTWSYSQLGAMSYHPPAGSVDAWTFGAVDPDVPPPFPPSAVRATNTVGGPTTTSTVAAPTTTAAPPTTGPVPPPTGAGGAGRPKVAVSGASSPPMTGAGGDGGEPAGTSPTGPGPTTSTTSGGAGRAAAGRSPSTPRIVDAAPASTHRPSAGSPLPLLAGAGLVAVLAVAAGVVARRRRRTS
jgi:hypothetical protein